MKIQKRATQRFDLVLQFIAVIVVVLGLTGCAPDTAMDDAMAGCIAFHQEHIDLEKVTPTEACEYLVTQFTREEFVEMYG